MYARTWKTKNTDSPFFYDGIVLHLPGFKPFLVVCETTFHDDSDARRCSLMKGGIYMAKELIEGHYMEAFLRTAILLSNPHCTVSVHESFMVRNHVRKLYPRCRIVARAEHPYILLKHFSALHLTRIILSSILFANPFPLDFQGTAVCLLSLLLAILLHSPDMYRYLFRWII